MARTVDKGSRNVQLHLWSQMERCCGGYGDSLLDVDGARVCARRRARARRRTVAVALAERDRLRRDLHDGLGPSLTGMSLGLEAVHDLLPPDNPSAEDVVVRLREEMRSTIGELRPILAGLQPGVLEERGLAEALRHRARTAAHAGGLAVAVTMPESLPPLAGELEVAAYRIADEALTNIVRHAQAQHATLTVTIADSVRLEICDDGRGPPSMPTNGVGLSSMGRRTEELGGQFLLEASRTGGTRVVATLPRGT